MPDDHTQDPALQRFADNLLAARQRAKLTQEAVATTAGISQTYYSRYERGRHDPGLRMLVRLAVALSTTIDDLTAGVLEAASSG